MPNTTHTALPLVVMISGSGSNLQAIIDAIATGNLAAKIVGVVSDKPDAYGLVRAQHAAIPTRVVSPQDYPDRSRWQSALQATIDALDPGLIAMAGFMRILEPAVAEHFAGRIINIHPSLLPELRGLHTHRRALQTGLSHHGTTIHFVTPELDGGPSILQARLAIHHDDDEDSLASRVQAAEHIIYPQVLQWFAQGRLGLHNNRTFMDGEPLAATPVRDL